jgi:phage-related minor tail protein
MAESDETDSADAAGAGLSATADRVSTSLGGLERSAGAFARAMTSAFTSAASGGRRFDDVLKSLALRLSSMALTAAFKPLTQGLAGGLQNLFGGIAGSALGASGGADKAIAAVMADVRPFATGGVIASPTYFPLGAGSLGLAGEAGPEAILPLARGADGRLGVAGGGGGGAPANVTVNIATPDAASFRRSETYVTGQIARAVARGQRGL